MACSSVASLLGIASIAASAAVFNHIFDQNIDRKMARTLRRPLVQKQLSVRSICCCMGIISHWRKLAIAI